MKKRSLRFFCFLLFALLLASPASGADDLFQIPSVEELPLKMEILSQKEEDGVRVTEFYLNGPPFGEEETRIYAFYARPIDGGPYPGVVQLHGSGLEVLKPDAAIEYAANQYGCISIDWAGPDWKGDGDLREKPCSEFPSSGNRAKKNPETGKWMIIPPERDARTNGIRFIRRALQFLRTQPEIDGSKLCVSGMSAGAQATLGVLGLEPEIRAAAVKYGSGFIKELNAGGAYGPIIAAGRDEPEAAENWIATLDPKHRLGDIKAETLFLSGTDDIFYFMPAVLATWRAIPSPKNLLMLPNDNHSQVGNEVIPRQWFSQVLNGEPKWPVLQAPEAGLEGEELVLRVAVQGDVGSVVFWYKQMPQKGFRHGRGGKDEATVPWKSLAAENENGLWVGKLPAPGENDQLIAYATAETADDVRASSDTVEFPTYPGWRLRQAP